MRKVFVNVTIKLIIQADEGIDIGNAIDEAKIIFQMDNANVEDIEILNHDITDSK